MTKARERTLAREMRRGGASLRQIARTLDVALSTASVWVRDVEVRAAAVDRPGDEPAVEPSLHTTHPSATGGDRRRCSRCDRTLSLSAFNRHGDGHQWWCRDCFREYYAADRARHRKRSATLKRRRVEAARAVVRSYLEQRPCVDCGEGDLVLLEFDHLGDKVMDVAALVARGASSRRLEAEIAKCEVVCCACHRRRTARRADWWRLDPLDPERRWKSDLVRRNFMHLHSVLTYGGCEDCDERDLVLLEFDHIGEKSATVTRLAYNEASLRRLREEVARCEIRCVRCHRRRTASARAHWRTR